MEWRRKDEVYRRMEGKHDGVRESENDPQGNMFRKGKEGMRERERETVRKHV